MKNMAVGSLVLDKSLRKCGGSDVGGGGSDVGGGGSGITHLQSQHSESKQITEFKGNVVSRASSGTTRATRRSPVSFERPKRKRKEITEKNRLLFYSLGSRKIPLYICITN